MLDQYSSIMDGLKGGKRIREHSYLHVSLLHEQPAPICKLVETAREIAGTDERTFNVVRISHDSLEVAFLDYGQFFEDPFPTLLGSCVVDLLSKSVRRTDHSQRANPNILHRKELLLSPNHPQRAQFASLTTELEKQGMFADPQRIGLKKYWTKQLASRGLKIVGHTIVSTACPKADASTGEDEDRSEKEVQNIGRHRTAIVRDRLSAPMQALARHGLLAADRTVLDYGCGQGDDVRALQAGGITVTGWDPHYAPSAPLKPADVVNLGFVLNVIEEPRERVEAARQAYDLAKQCLAVAVMVVGKGDTTGHRPFRDGFLTGRSTFQKYYRQEEIKELLDRALGAEAIAVAPGIFFVFKDKLLEQRFLLDRQRRIRVPVSPELRPPLDRPTLAQRRIEALRPLLTRLWEQILAAGRVLVEEEVAPDLLAEIQSQIGSLRRAERLANSCFDVQELKAAANARRQDLLVYFGLNLFNGRTRYSMLPPELQRDIKVFFGNATSVFEAGRALLFSVGKPEVINSMCRQAAAAGLGYLNEGHSLQLHTSELNKLPAALRCYVGCGAKLYGDVDTADLIKIHIRSGKLTLLFYDDFDSSPLPRLRERIKINMRSQRIDFFEHATDREQQLLYLKSRYIPTEQPGYERQKKFDDALVKLGLFDFAEYGPAADVFQSILSRAGYIIGNFELQKSSFLQKQVASRTPA
jgi:DNA phosphorothioation-associated putative methyltransferase